MKARPKLANLSTLLVVPFPRRRRLVCLAGQVPVRGGPAVPRARLRPPQPAPGWEGLPRRLQRVGALLHGRQVGRVEGAGTVLGPGRSGKNLERRGGGINWRQMAVIVRSLFDGFVM